MSTVRDGSPPHDWLPSDRLLLVALQLLEDGTCKGCGRPMSEAWDTDASYEVPVAVCAGCAALHNHQHRTTDPAPGSKPYLSLETVTAATKFAPVYD